LTTSLFAATVMEPGTIKPEMIVPGTIVPVELKSSLNTNKAKPGEVITARVAQDVPLPGGSTIPAGAKIIGHVVEVRPADLALRFDVAMVDGHKVAITASLRALASMMAVWEAQLPTTGPDRGTPESAWTTVQVGGEVVYRGGGPVVSGREIVGRPTSDGVLIRARSQLGGACRGEPEDNNRPQAFWVFSSTACGTYDLPHVRIAHAGRSAPLGEIVLASDTNVLNIRSGSGMLLRITSIGK
jgi:hypothetical protein